MNIKFYKQGTRRHPVSDFIKSLPKEDIATITGCLQSIEKFGFDSPRVEFRQISGPLWEIKIKTARSGYRLFYVCIKSNHIVLLHAYKKQSQKAPIKEIEIAKKRMLEVYNEESTYIN